MERPDVLVVGGGSAGLATSHELAARGIDHLVLERGRIGQAWRDRWSSFCLVTPNWSVRLPGGEYAGPDPNGFMPRDEMVGHLTRYAASFGAPVREGVAVEALREAPGGGFAIDTSSGEIRAKEVVLANGAFQRPHRPHADTLPADVAVLGLEDYTTPEAVPVGDVLIIGSGQSGVQLAEELSEAGRSVVLSCGRAPWIPRRLGGRDIVWWLVESGFWDQPASALPSPMVRLVANPLVSGHDGGHDLNYRTLRRMGVTLVGRFLGADGRLARFAPDLGASVAFGDDRYRELMALFAQTAARLGLPPLNPPEPEPFNAAAPEALDLAGFGAVIYTGGFRPDYVSWLPWPDAFDAQGFPLQHEGASTVVPGLSFAGVHFLRKRKSGILWGVGEDAGVVADGVAARLGVSGAS